MITVHHLEHSRSQRVLWLLEELDLPYEVVRYARDAKTMLAPPELRAVHPLGKSPVLVDGELVVVESGAILEYLLERYDLAQRFAPPPHTTEYLRYRQWMHYAEGSLMPPLLLSLVFTRVKHAPMPFFARPVAKGIVAAAMASFIGPKIQLHLDYLEAELTRSTWFAGNQFSAADIQMSYPLEVAAVRIGLDGRQHLQAYLERMRERPAYQRALVSGGPFELMG